MQQGKAAKGGAETSAGDGLLTQAPARSRSRAAGARRCVARTARGTGALGVARPSIHDPRRALRRMSARHPQRAASVLCGGMAVQAAHVCWTAAEARHPCHGGRGGWVGECLADAAGCVNGLTAQRLAAPAEHVHGADDTRGHQLLAGALLRGKRRTADRAQLCRGAERVCCRTTGETRTCFVLCVAGLQRSSAWLACSEA
jgi:hypothetical protein